MIYNDDRGNMLSLYEHRLHSSGHVSKRHNKVDRPEMDDDDKAAEDEQKAIMEAVKLDKMRKHMARRHRDEIDHQIEENVSTLWTGENIASLASIARETDMPVMCLFGTLHANKDMLATWNNFCRRAREGIQLHHCEHGELKICCVTQFDTFMQLDSEWTTYYLQNNKLYELEIWILMDHQNELQRMSDLPDGAKALVYDVECSRSQQAMRDWECSEQRYVIPLFRTPFPYGCVVTRDKEMYHIIKL